MSRIIVFSLLVAGISMSSCRKDATVPGYPNVAYLGSYSCSVSSSSWMMGTVGSDTMYTKSVTVSATDSTVLFQNTAFQIDTIVENHWYFQGYSYNHSQLMFVADSVYYKYSGGGLGGGSHGQYSCKLD